MMGYVEAAALAMANAQDNALNDMLWAMRDPAGYAAAQKERWLADAWKIPRP